MKQESELRIAAKPVELRMDDEAETVSVRGYAAVFDEEVEIGRWFREVIRPGAFRDAIGRDDVVFLVNHAGLPLARTRSGTLTLQEDKRGLLIEAELDMSDPDVQQIVPKMKRGDLDKMSFAFWPTKETWTDPTDDEEVPLREVLEAELFDVAIVTTPAYEGTEIGLRAFEAYKANHSINPAARRARMSMQLGLRARKQRDEKGAL